MRRLLALAACLLAAASAQAQSQSDDVLSILQWALKAVGWAPLEVKPGAREVVVAVIDSGLDVNHPDLQGRVWTNPSPDAAKKDLHGWNFLDDNGDIGDEIGRSRAGGHGTHVAGIIAAVAGNKIGIAGVAPPNVKVMVLKVVKDFSRDSNSDPETGLYKGKPLTHYVAQAVRYAVEHKADVINLSLGWPRLIDIEDPREAIREAITKGIHVVAAAGNDGKAGPTFPCTYDGVICVANLEEPEPGHDNRLASSSNFGGKVDVVAPGENVVSLWPMGKQSRDLEVPDFEKLFGTSQAAPLVSGILASLYAVNPSMTHAEARARLLAGAAPAVPDAQGRHTLFGLVNVARSLEAKPRVIVAPNFKSLDDVILSQDLRKFAFSIRLQSYWLAAQGVRVKLALEADDGVTLDQTELGPIDLAAGGTSGDSTELKLTGKVTSLDADSRGRLFVTVLQGTTELGRWSADLELSRPVASFGPGEVFEVKHPQNPAWEPGLLRVGRGAARIVEIENFTPPKGRPEYFWVEKTRVWLLRPGQGEPVAIDPPGLRAVFDVSRIPVGSRTGYVILGYLGTRPEDFALQFSFYDDELKPWLGEKNHWRYPTPLKIDFEMIRQNYNRRAMAWTEQNIPGLGLVPVPIFREVGFLPELDRPSDPFRRDARERGFHLYYLKPEVSADGVRLALRALDSFAFRQELEKKLDLRVQDELVVQNLLAPAPMAVLSAGRGFKQHYLLATVTSDGKLTTAPLDTRGVHLLSNRAVGLEGAVETGFLTNFDFNRLRVSALDPSSRTLLNFPIEYGTEDEPLLGFLGGVIGNDGKATLLLEGDGRVYDMQAGPNGLIQVKSMELEGDQSLSERASRDRVKFVAPFGRFPYGLYVDSTNVRGNRVFIALNDSGSSKALKRPIRYALNFGENCLGFQPDWRSSGELRFSLLCRDSASSPAWRLHYLKP